MGVVSSSSNLCGKNFEILITHWELNWRKHVEELKTPIFLTVSITSIEQTLRQHEAHHTATRSIKRTRQTESLQCHNLQVQAFEYFEV
jgi:hypothetical protein